MRPKYESHNGVCAHCHTQVPVDAPVCAGCGARWGFSNGLNRPSQYDSFIGMYRLSWFLFLASVLFISAVYLTPLYDYGPEAFGAYAISGAVLLWSLNKLIICRAQLSVAKSGELMWFR